MQNTCMIWQAFFSKGGRYFVCIPPIFNSLFRFIDHWVYDFVQAMKAPSLPCSQCWTPVGRKFLPVHFLVDFLYYYVTHVVKKFGIINFLCLCACVIRFCLPSLSSKFRLSAVRTASVFRNRLILASAVSFWYRNTDWKRGWGDSQRKLTALTSGIRRSVGSGAVKKCQKARARNRQPRQKLGWRTVILCQKQWHL